MALCFSPVGNKLRVRARKFPGVVNCTSIDWFLNWPNEALLAVGNHFLLKQHALIYEATMTIPTDKASKTDKPSERTEERKRSKGLEPIVENEDAEREDVSGNDPNSATKFKESESAATKIEEHRAGSRDYGNPEAFTPVGSDHPKDFAVDGDLEEDPELLAIAQMTMRERVSHVFT